MTSADETGSVMGITGVRMFVKADDPTTTLRKYEDEITFTAQLCAFLKEGLYV